MAHRAKDRLRLEEHESAGDAVAVIAAIAMKRAATFGRAPAVNDVDFAMELLGYLGDAPADVREWRPDVVRAAGHDYVVRRAVVDTVGSGLLRLPISELPENLAMVREAMARAAEEAVAADDGSDIDLGEPEGDVGATDDWEVADRQDPDGTADHACSDTLPVRVRFAPAPTGFLHVGSVRTALFNWLYARHHGGTFLLRVEDTDAARSRGEWILGIQDTMRWLGLDCDEGPYLQSDRLDQYAAAAGRLLRDGRAYECYCTPEEVKARSDAALKAGRPPGYDGQCRELTEAEREAQAAEGRPRSIRFRTPDAGVSSFTDLVRGEVAVEWSTVSDFVIVRSDNSPVFFLANAVDDAEMEINRVIRGEDLLDTTHRVLALREALGYDGPIEFGHLPLLVGADRAKLSKRHGAVAIEDFRDRGYLPDAFDQLPRAARVGTGGRARSAQSRRADRRIRPRSCDPLSRVLRLQEARLAQR